MGYSRTEPDDRNHPFHSAHFGLWLSWQELNGRRIVLFINLVLIALLISLPVTLDFMGKARKGSIETRIDYMGPSLSLVPKGIRSSDLTTAQLKGMTISQQDYAYLRSDMGALLRGAEIRLITNLPIGKTAVPVVGIDFQDMHTYPFSQFSPTEDEVLLGTIAADKLKRQKGDTIEILERSFSVAGVISTTAGIDDVSLFLSLPVLQKLTGKQGRINEIRLFPRSAAALETLKQRIGKYYGQFDIVDSYRGETAEKDIESTLGEYQRALYIAAFILIALCIIISTYINLDGRKSEISTIYTLGATKRVILQVLTFRTLWIALLGAVAGHCLALLATFVQDSQVPLQQIWSWKSFAFIVSGTMLLGLFVSTPFTMFSVYKKNLIEHL